ncbi:uncharacterized protein LOC9316653 [Arabidopsis lyrata subsp. lyrata]|uniref:uncharacterized protein LOC9316653 n=1 Tax=Arabidopsis lyrata subsp. lyrata TaxID=81972 RepID=UPI000A29D569|nr:uncharacterized protein LOC9316653 [Arabidopsis lyrata subsp. lyrata]|eukprot:XP_020883505.1 uncharacterized protein LOC9316653 [Arabidopsis lyrata subsp. lyrata]
MSTLSTTSSTSRINDSVLRIYTTKNSIVHDLNLCGILEETARRGISFDELLTIPEQDEWVYSDGKSTSCVAFILAMYKAAGVFGPLANHIQVIEFTIRDAYTPKLFESNQTRLPSWCNTEEEKLDFCHILVLAGSATAWSHTPPSGLDEFIIDGNDDSFTSLGSYRDPSRLIFLNFQNFEPNYVYQLLKSQLHDHVLSEQIAYQRLRSQSSELPQQPISMRVTVKLTQKVYDVVSCSSAPSTTDLGKEEESETCAICLENLLRGSKDYRQMPNCSHCFHEQCVTKWLVPQNNSCPLCRRPIKGVDTEGRIDDPHALAIP